MAQLALVTTADCGQLEGDKIGANRLHDEVKKVCPGITGEALWEKILSKFNLGQRDCQTWVANMNAAILIWNQNQPTSCTDIAQVYQV